MALKGKKKDTELNETEGKVVDFPVVAENAFKKVSKAAEKTKASEDDDAPAKPEKKGRAKKADEGESAGGFKDVLTHEMMESYQLESYDSMFPKVVESTELGTLKRLDMKGGFDKFKKMVEEEEKTIYMATHFTKRRIKAYGYNEFFFVKAPKTGFENNLDLSNVVLTCDTIDRMYAMSAATEALYRIEAEDFEPVPFHNPATGEDETIYLNGEMPFAMYEGKAE